MSARGASGAQATPFAIICACLAFSDNAAEVEAFAARGAFDWPAVLRLAGHHLVTPSLAASLSRKGLRDFLDDEARAEAELFLVGNPHFTTRHWAETEPFRDAGTLEHFIDGYRKAGLPD